MIPRENSVRKRNSMSYNLTRDGEATTSFRFPAG